MKKSMTKISSTDLVARPRSSLTAHTDIPAESVKEIAGSLTALLADVFALYIKTKNFHWHMSDRIFGTITSCLMNKGEQIFAITDDIAEHLRSVTKDALLGVNSN